MTNPIDEVCKAFEMQFRSEGNFVYKYPEDTVVNIHEVMSFLRTSLEAIREQTLEEVRVWVSKEDVGKIYGTNIPPYHEYSKGWVNGYKDCRSTILFYLDSLKSKEKDV
jgi:hypothetical protein